MPHKARHTSAHGRMAAAQRGGGILLPEHRQILEDYYRFPEREARAAFADKWIRLSAAKLDTTWRVFYELLDIIRKDKLYENPTFMEDRKARSSFEEYWTQVIQKPFATWLELEKTYHFVSQHAPELFEETLEKANNARERSQNAAQNTDGQGLLRGGDQKSEDRKSKSKLDFDPLPKRAQTHGVGRYTQHKIDHLARNRPDLHEQVKSGALSVDAAYRQAKNLPRKVSVPIDVDAAARVLRRHFKGDDLARLISKLQDDDPSH